MCYINKTEDFNAKRENIFYNIIFPYLKRFFLKMCRKVSLIIFLNKKKIEKYPRVRGLKSNST